MWKSLFLSLGISAGVAVQALPKAVCFRFDDNQNVRKYSVMAETFRKNNAVFSFSLNPLRSEGKKWQEMVCRLSAEGFDIMDHTPIHSTLTIHLAPGDPLLEKAKKADFLNETVKDMQKNSRQTHKEIFDKLDDHETRISHLEK